MVFQPRPERAGDVARMIFIFPSDGGVPSIGQRRPFCDNGIFQTQSQRGRGSAMIALKLLREIEIRL